MKSFSKTLRFAKYWPDGVKGLREKQRLWREERSRAKEERERGEGGEEGGEKEKETVRERDKHMCGLTDGERREMAVYRWGFCISVAIGMRREKRREWTWEHMLKVRCVRVRVRVCVYVCVC